MWGAILISTIVSVYTNVTTAKADFYLLHACWFLRTPLERMYPNDKFNRIGFYLIGKESVQ